MEQILELFLKNGLRPLSMLPDMAGLERVVNRSEIAVLLMLHFRGKMTMTALASELGAPLSTMTSLAQRLVRKGLIERRQSGTDQRIILVQLTDEGLQLVLQVKATIEKVFIRVQAALSADELNQFLALAVKIGKAVQERETGGTEAQTSKVRNIPIED
ncbi:MarR family winged helix-turn-helix transcriptional regulator [Paenibacillus validus]|uniref:MarR family winged helix-turn-helix transcriptional regulator n=1 Tax=Paenibacillus validus TaxID=44253 RepID=UPI003D267E6A